MEPRPDEFPDAQVTTQVQEPQAEPEPRFRIIKLEESMVPDKGDDAVRTHGRGCGGGNTRRCCRCGR